MNGNGDLDERLREAAALGNEDLIEELVKQGADVNSGNHMNGWTALHWACRRNHPSVVQLLVKLGADPSIANDKDQLPNQLTTAEAIHDVLGKPMNVADSVDSLPIVPNYIRHPQFPYASSGENSSSLNHVPDSPRRLPESVYHPTEHLHSVPQSRNFTPPSSPELVLKVRIARTNDSDFIEVELNRNKLTYQALVEKCCEELEVDAKDVVKVRKLPNTIMRKDKDVQRLSDFQELEIVVQRRSAAEAYHLQIQKMDLVY